MKEKLEELAKALTEAQDTALVYWVAGELEKIAKEIEESLKDGSEQLRLAQEEEERTEEAMDSMNRTYWEGYTEALEGLMAGEGK
jgi:hypothetical protein